MLRDFCSVCVGENNEFVGMRFVDGSPVVTFPRGFRLANDDADIRKDILRLLATIQKFSDKKDGFSNDWHGKKNVQFPLLSFQHIIRDFLAHGYYIEREDQYNESTKGKINWKRTIQQEKPQIDNGNVVYLDFIVKTSKINQNTLIAKIHEYCVYESFKNIGWLYVSGDTMPRKPQIKLNKKVFLATLKNALVNTFNSSKKLLLTSMINVIEYANESVSDKTTAKFGTHNFEYVWERMIDFVFGEDNKEIYFPHAKWHIINNSGTVVESSALLPDTIMLYEDKIYILDAKYYKYGITGYPNHLPNSSSIQKQITYGEYIDKSKLFSFKTNNIYNAFVMPFGKEAESDENLKFVSVGTADWKEYDESTFNYNYVLGILLDVKHIITTYSKLNFNEIEVASTLIEDSLEGFKKKIYSTQ